MPQRYVITADLLENVMKALNLIYDIVRVIDPVEKKVKLLSDKGLIGHELHCFGLWGKNKVCDNCISIRAYQENRVLFKLEYLKEKIYIVMAVPVQDEDKLIILELIKDVTDSLIVNDPLSIQNDEVLKLLHKVSQSQVRDGLTGLFNKRFINERLPAEIINGFAGSQQPSIIIADIDHFKKVNDTYGHVAGDFVLKEFSNILLSHVHEEDGWVARYGGEEFLISLRDAGPVKAKKITEDIRMAVENKVMHYEEQDISITCSFGISTLCSSKDVAIEDWIKSADDNLYIAKSQGRNRIICGCM